MSENINKEREQELEYKEKEESLKLKTQRIASSMIKIYNSDSEESDSDKSKSESDKSESDKSESDINESDKNESDSDNSETSEEFSNEKNNDKHIPIIVETCKEYKWDNGLNEFKDHYSNCVKCNKTDNNNISYMTFLNKTNSKKIKMDELKDDDEIEEYLEYYHGTQGYKMKSKYSVFIFRIHNRSHPYHKCLLIVW